jgi:hypothetical protein
VVDDPQDLDEAEGGSQPAQGRLLVGVDLGHGPSELSPRWLVAAGPQVQVDPAALEFELVDLAFAEVLTAGLEGQDLQVAGEALELGQQFSYGHPTQRSVPSALCGLELGAVWPDRSDRELHMEPRMARMRGVCAPTVEPRTPRTPYKGCGVGCAVGGATLAPTAHQWSG